MEQRYVVFGYTSARWMRQLAARSRGQLRVADERSAYLVLEQGVTQPDQIISQVKLLLQSD